MLPVKNPSQNTAMLLRKLAADRGIFLPLPLPGRAPKLNYIHEHRSKKLLEIVEDFLTFSNSMMAELVLLKSAQQYTGVIQRQESASMVMKKFLQKVLKGATLENMVLENGSGLSTRARISP